jgi:hypothetical protein
MCYDVAPVKYPPVHHQEHHHNNPELECNFIDWDSQLTPAVVKRDGNINENSQEIFNLQFCLGSSLKSLPFQF